MDQLRAFEALRARRPGMTFAIWAKLKDFAPDDLDALLRLRETMLLERAG